jgi:AbiV family abortive infection protein
MLDILARGARITLENAEALCREAEILAAAGARCRALFLHQISLEECSKIENMGAWATSVLTGTPTDKAKVLAAMRRHSSKNRTNAYMLSGSHAEAAATANGDIKTAIAEFDKLKAAFDQESNAAKNASLYVDFVDGGFVAPVERIDAAMLAKIRERNIEFIELMRPKAHLVEAIRASPQKYQPSMLAFIAKAEAMRAAAPADPKAAILQLVGEFLAEGLKPHAGDKADEE